MTTLLLVNSSTYKANNFIFNSCKEQNISFAENTVSVQSQRFPFPAYKQDEFVSIIELNMPFIILLCLIYIAQRTARFVAVEKETGLKVSFSKTSKMIRKVSEFRSVLF